MGRVGAWQAGGRCGGTPGRQVRQAGGGGGWVGAGDLGRWDHHHHHWIVRPLARGFPFGINFPGKGKVNSAGGEGRQVAGSVCGQVVR